MQFDFLERIAGIRNSKKTIEIEEEKNDIKQEEIELAQKLDAIEEFSVDRFENEIVVLENRQDGNSINVKRTELPMEIKEGDILKKVNGKYYFDKEKTINESNRIKRKMNDLWN